MLPLDGKQLVVKSNQIIEACYSLPLNGHRLIALALASTPRDVDEFPPLTLRVRDIADVIPALRKTKRVFEMMENIVDEIMDSTITLKQEDSWVKFQWLTKAAYKDGVVHLQINNELIPYFSGLLSRFTSYQIRYVVGFRSAYSFRVYDLCKQYLKIGHRDISIDDLRAWLDISPTLYKQIGHLKSKVIKPALADINRTSDLEVVLGPDKKEGRRTVGLHFVISERSQQAIPLNETLPNTLQRLVTHGVNLSKARSLIDEFTEAHCIKQLDWVQKQHADGKVKNLGAFTVSAIQRGFDSKPAPLEQEAARVDNERNLLERRNEQVAKLTETFNRLRVDDFLESTKREEVDRIQKEFLSSLPEGSLLFGFHRKSGFSHPLLFNGLRALILDKYLPPADPIELEAFLDKRPEDKSSDNPYK